MRKRCYIIWRKCDFEKKVNDPRCKKQGQVVACIGNYGCEVMSDQCLG